MIRFALGFVPAIATAAPVTIVHQGRLVDVAGNAINGERTVDVGLYADGSTPTALWHEAATLTVDDGYYTVTLGTDTVGNPLDDSVFDGSPRYVGVTVTPGGALGPRQLLVAVPYAARATTTSNVAPGGTVRLGTGSATCAGGALEGTVRYTSAGGFEGCTTSGWGPLGGATFWNCASHPTHAGCVSSSVYASCSDLLDDPAFNGNSAAYWIDPDLSGPGAPINVWCDMSLASGGWTLAGVITSTDGIASHDCTANWEWHDARWTDANTLNASTFNDTVDHKYASWATVPFTELLIQESVNGSQAWKSWNVGARSSLSQLFGIACTSVSTSPTGVGGSTSHDNAVIHGSTLRVNCVTDTYANNDSSRLSGSTPGNLDGLGCYNGGWGLGVDGDTENCTYGSEARPARGGWTNQCYSQAVYYQGGSVWSGGTQVNVGPFWARIYVR
jgi:hypothetical protein